MVHCNALQQFDTRQTIMYYHIEGYFDANLFKFLWMLIYFYWKAFWLFYMQSKIQTQYAWAPDASSQVNCNRRLTNSHADAVINRAAKFESKVIANCTA